MAPFGESFYTFMGALSGAAIFVGAIGPLNMSKVVFYCVPLAMWAGGFIGLSFWRWLSSRNR